MSYVRRPSSKSNGSPNNLPISSPNTGSASPSGATQPPNLNPPVGSSSGPPGACITPSIETIAPTITLLMGLSCAFSEDELHPLDRTASERGRIVLSTTPSGIKIAESPLHEQQ